MFLHAESEESDHTGQMPRLIRVFAGHTHHFVGFVMLQLINYYSYKIFIKITFACAEDISVGVPQVMVR